MKILVQIGSLFNNSTVFITLIDKVKKGKEAIERGESISIGDLKKEMESW
ncbi:MAG: hypothetical protein GY777_17505 [Candidatus Brocadiaceae bacterium]|nr:hypothetical protein [Candidatus Brocadiaceae bacterium]